MTVVDYTLVAILMVILGAVVTAVAGQMHNRVTKDAFAAHEELDKGRETRAEAANAALMKALGDMKKELKDDFNTALKSVRDDIAEIRSLLFDPTVRIAKTRGRNGSKSSSLPRIDS